MDKNTLEKLKKNPHYKLSPKQREAEREDMVEFGVVPLHDQTIQKHPVRPKVIGRKHKDVVS